VVVVRRAGGLRRRVGHRPQVLRGRGATSAPTRGRSSDRSSGRSAHQDSEGDSRPLLLRLRGARRLGQARVSESLGRRATARA
jgi:hypothetical protein